MLDVSSVTIVGHSFGGGIAMQLAYQHPHLVDRLVLVCSGGLGRDVSWMLRLLTLPGAEYLMPVLFPKMLVEPATEVGRFLGRRDIRRPYLAEMWRAYSSLAGAPNRKAFVRTMRGVIEPSGQIVNAADRLYLAARVPTLIIWGDQDGIIPVQHGVDAHEQIGGSRFELLEGVGHFPHVEAPDRFSDVLLDFLDSAEPGASPKPLGDVIVAGSSERRTLLDSA